jgi:CRISPR system Cascade subunit CasC
MLIQIHLLQNYVPANLNRDDTGAPKDAIFGGKRRGRISSQCLKRSIRRSDTFKQTFAAGNLLGVRTKLLPSLISEELQALGADAATVKAIIDRVPEIGRESKKTKEAERKHRKRSCRIRFVWRDQTVSSSDVTSSSQWPRSCSDVPDHRFCEVGKAKNLLNHRWPRGRACPFVDIAMFGRMTTSPARSKTLTRRVRSPTPSLPTPFPEFDYYTAVDDLSRHRCRYDRRCGIKQLHVLQVSECALGRAAKTSAGMWKWPARLFWPLLQPL